MDTPSHEARFQALIPRALALVASDALRELSSEQEFVARADLREGGTANSRVLAALLELSIGSVQRERRSARRQILRRVRHLLGDGGWSSLVLALRTTGWPVGLAEGASELQAGEAEHG